MKKILVVAVAMIFATSFSQEKEVEKEFKKRSAGLELTGSRIPSFGVFYERFWKIGKNYTSQTYELSSVSANKQGTFNEFTGSGFQISSGTKLYSSDKGGHKGLFYKNSLVYGNIKFDEKGFLENYKGTYSYFSIFNPEIGYDFMIAKTLRTSFTAGTQWQIEVKGKENVDNRDFDNWIFNFGVKLSYDF